MDIGQVMNPNITAHQEGMQESINFMQGRQPKSLPPWKPSKEDNEAINKLTAQMAEKTSREDIVKIRANLDNMTVQQRELMNQKGVGPLVYFFRTQAVKMLLGNPSLVQALWFCRARRRSWHVAAFGL
jgi:hypothetical protein